ncbi:replication protein [Amylibacter marinus]|uniref:Replication protein n=1 Tax=Amylibacter marinus TaxID=1475483 RepID=A0ABQ5VWL8_9RHOB|nr:ParB N-terminal domain-containing protein [Amylibacter marinus]GLQ35817.1 replication protein [Amylibacter marinus]
MSKKRRMFDIDMPDMAATESPAAPETKSAMPARRGPMATAINETSASLKERAAIEAEIRAENDALAQNFVALKKAGLVLDRIPVTDVETYKLTRDRAVGKDYELDELKASIAEIGLSNPIQVEARSDGRYELIQGFRRLSAYRELLEETGDSARFGHIPAGIVQEGESIESLYRKMVDENLVRKDISFAEMAALAISYAADPNTIGETADKSVAILFKAASYQKRSYIRGFVKLLQELGSDLEYPQYIPRSLGLGLQARMDEEAGIAGAIKRDLAPLVNRSVADELAVLRAYVGEVDEEAPTPETKARKDKGPRQAKTTFQISRPEGTAKCTASSGRLEVRLARDFSTVDRLRLEDAVRRLLDQLD